MHFHLVEKLFGIGQLGEAIQKFAVDQNERFEYKLLSLIYKVLTTSQLDYLHNLISV